MKRDMNLIRDLLLEIETNQSGTPYSGRDWGPEHYYHLVLLADAGYIEVPDRAVIRSNTGAIVSLYVMAISWRGHEFLDTVRDAGVYAQAKEKIGDKLASTSLEIFTQVAAGIIKSSLGLPS